jgi:hypothetical protein
VKDEEMNLSDGTRVCVDCEQIFVMDDGEILWFKGHGFTMPLRCESCRQYRKELAHQADVETPGPAH